MGLLILLSGLTGLGGVTLFKLILTPALMLLASLVERRWGATVGGLLIGLPLTSGPVAFFVAVERGPAFARQTVAGILLGTISVGLFCLAYSWVATRWSWPVALLAGWTATAVATLTLSRVSAQSWLVVVVTLAALVALHWLLPRTTASSGRVRAPWWDLPGRIVIATTYVVLLTEGAPVIGPHLSGLLATFPIYASIMASFGYHLMGREHAIRFMRGLALGLFGFTAFFAALAALLGNVSLGLAFGAATVAALAVQGLLAWGSGARAAWVKRAAPAGERSGS